MLYILYIPICISIRTYIYTYLLVHTLCRLFLFESDQSKNLRTCDYRDLSETAWSSLQMSFTLLPLPFLKVYNSSFLVSVDQKFWKRLDGRFRLRVFQVAVVKCWLWQEQVIGQYLLFKCSLRACLHGVVWASLMHSFSLATELLRRQFWGFRYYCCITNYLKTSD